MDFKGSKKIVLSTYDYDKEIAFAFPAASSAVANDGAIPVGTSPVSAIVDCFTEDGSAVTSIFVGSPSVAGQNVNVSLQYPTEGEGRYYLRFKLTITGSQLVDATFNRVFAEDTSEGK